jgi:hypothetical protein
MVGGLILARGLKKSEGLEFLKDCHGFLRESLANSGSESASAKSCRTKGRKAEVGESTRNSLGLFDVVLKLIHV